MRKYRQLAATAVILVLAIGPTWRAGAGDPLPENIDKVLNPPTLRGIKGLIVTPMIEGNADHVGLTKEQLKTDAELRLRRSGIKVPTFKEWGGMPGKPSLLIHILLYKDKNTNLYSYSVEVELWQSIRLDRNNQIKLTAPTWVRQSIGTKDGGKLREIRKVVDDKVDEFINAYLAENPPVPAPATGKPLPTTKREIVGVWIDSMNSSRITIYRDGKSLYADQVLNDGTSFKLQLTESKSALGRRFELKGDKADAEPTARLLEMMATPQGKEFAKTKLAELDKFKSTSDFRTYGFGPGGRFYTWLKDVEAKRKDPKFTYYDQLAAGSLVMLGTEYLWSKGQETKFTPRHRREILETIELGSPNSDLDDHWILNANGDLEMRDIDGLMSTARKEKKQKEK